MPVTKQKAGTLTDMAPDFALYTYICLHIAEHFRQPVLHFGMRASSGGPNVIFSIDTSTLMKLQSMRMGDRSPALRQKHYLHFARRLLRVQYIMTSCQKRRLLRSSFAAGLECAVCIHVNATVASRKAAVCARCSTPGVGTLYAWGCTDCV